MKRALVLFSLVALTSSARADNRDAWQATFAGSVVVGIAGVIMQVHGRHQIDDAHDALCDGGAYAMDPECTTNQTLTQAEVDHYNAKGTRGQTVARIGLATTVVAIPLAGVALYKGFIKPRSRVVVAPNVSTDHAGVALQITW